MKLNSEERSLLLDAIGANRGEDNSVLCDECQQPIIIRRDDQGRAVESTCECGKYNSTFRPL